MPTSRHWQYTDESEDMYTDDDGNVLYYDRQGKLRRYKSTDREFQQRYHYEED